MKQIKLFNLNENINNLNKIWAHCHEAKQPELLEEHLELSLKYLFSLFDKKGIGNVLNNIIDNIIFDGKTLDKQYSEFIKEMFVNAIYMHDLGKINHAFQKEKMSNPEFENTCFGNSEHSLLSSIIYIDVFGKQLEDIEDDNLYYFMNYILYSFAYVISRHHTYLKDMNDFIDKLSGLHKEKYFINYNSDTIMQLDFSLDGNPFIGSKSKYDYWKIDGLKIYILNKLLYALLVSTDFYATDHYFNSKEIEFGLIDNVEEIISEYQRTKIYQGIQSYKFDKRYFKDTPINALRSEMFLEAEDNLFKNINSNIFYLEAPTGGGKTNCSINLALNIVKECKDIKKIFYIFPFNTLVEQTKKTFEDLFGKQKGNPLYAVINSITPIITKSEIDSDDGDNRVNYKDNIDYEGSLLDRQFLHYPIILTTHINFFNYLFGTGREVNFPLVQLCNSVVILDEIQSYRNEIWREIIEFLNKYSKLLNIKIIIMSATLPKLDKLLGQEEGFIELIKNKEKYYQNNLFKERVKLNYELLEENPMTLQLLEKKFDEILNKRDKPTKVLFEFIKKDTARDFYNLIKDNYENVIELSGDDNKFVREQALKAIKECNNVIVVATQVIEAGVDIDMDIGFKDSSLLDSEEQFLGRINRSCLKDDCMAYFFDLDPTEKIYREDLRIEENISKDIYRTCLENKDFTPFYDKCFERIGAKKGELNKNHINNLFNAAMKLDFNNIQNKMQLIRERNFQLYIPYILKKENDFIDGFKLWESYKKLCTNNDLSYAQKQVELSIINENINLFVFNIISNGKSEPAFYTEKFGNYYFVANGEEFIDENGKFDRRKYINSTGGLFL